MLAAATLQRAEFEKFSRIMARDRSPEFLLVRDGLLPAEPFQDRHEEDLANQVLPKPKNSILIFFFACLLLISTVISFK